MIDDILERIQQEDKQRRIPLIQFNPRSKIVIIGQAPGQKAQQKGKLFDDKSGEELKRWLGVDENTFRKEFTIFPMDFYFPGKSKSGDLPPRKGIAPKWHPLILKELSEVRLILLIGQYAQKEYLHTKNLTDTVRNYKAYGPYYFPLVHPSPLNFRWHLKNPWFKQEVIPILQETIQRILKEDKDEKI